MVTCDTRPCFPKNHGGRGGRGGSFLRTEVRSSQGPHTSLACARHGVECAVSTPFCSLGGEAPRDSAAWHRAGGPCWGHPSLSPRSECKLTVIFEAISFSVLKAYLCSERSELGCDATACKCEPFVRALSRVEQRLSHGRGDISG